MNFIKELVCLVHNINLFDYEFLEITRPNDCGQYLVIFKYKYTNKGQYMVYTLPYLVYQMAINCTDDGIAAKNLAKQLGNKNMLKYYQGLLDKSSLESEYYQKQISNLEKELNGNHS